MQDLEQRVRSFISDNFFVPPSELDGEASLLGSGIVDSTGVLEIILHLEEVYGIVVPDHEVLPKNLDSVNKLVRYIASKQAVQA